MASIDPKALRERCEKRFSGMRAQRASWEPHWRNIATFEQPMRGRWLTDDPSRGDQFNTKLLNTKAVEDSEILANGMASGLTSGSRPWFKVGTLDKDLLRFQPAKVWCSQVEDAMRSLFHGTNFYPATHSGYRELGLYGIEAAIMTQHWRERAVVHPLTVGEYWIGLGDALAPDSLYRKCPMTVAMAVQKFGKKVSRTVQNLYDQAKYDEWVPIMHAIEPNPERIPGMRDRSNMLFRSVYWEEKCDDVDKDVLAFEGFEQQPFWAPRWDAGGATPLYSRGPGSQALFIAEQLQQKELRLQQGEDYAVRPALVGPPQLEQSQGNLQPGGKTFLSGQDLAQYRAIWEINPAVLTVLERDIARLEQRMDRTWFVDLFKAITDMEGVQPRNDSEIGQRVEEKMTQLGPVVERVMKEKLQVAINIAFEIVVKNKLVPQAPKEMHGQPLHIEFISVLAQAQRSVGLGAIERTAGFALNIIRAAPEAGDKFDFDKAIDGYSDLAGTPPDMIRTDDDVAKIRAGRAQQQQAAQAAAMAKPAKDGAEAVKTMQEARTAAAANPNIGSGGTALEGLLGGGGQ